MSLEQALQENTAALLANTAALLGAQASCSTETATINTTPAKATRSTKAKETVADKSPATKATTCDEARAALTKLKDTHGLEEAKKILAAHGVAKMVDMPDSKADAIYGDAVAKFAELESASQDTDDDGL